MKYPAILFFSGLLILSSCNKNDRKEGNSKWLPDVINKDHGPTRQKEYKGDFDEIEVSQSIEAEIIKSDVERVVISAPENIIDEILIDNKDGELRIHYRSGVRVMNTHNVKAKIYTKDFTKLEANAAAEIVVRDKFTQEKTDIEVSSAGHITGNLEANELNIDAASSGTFKGQIWAIDLDVESSSAADIVISGKAKNASLKASSAGDISAKDIVAENVKADASSGSSIEIGVSAQFEGHASAGGSVKGIRKGNVSLVRKDENSGGSVVLQ